MNLIQVFTEIEKDKLIQNGLKLVCVQNIDDKKAYVFNANNFNFELLSDIKYIKSNKLLF